MGGRGYSSATARRGVTREVAIDNATKEPLLGGQIAEDLGISPRKADQYYRALSDWANGSTGIKNAQRGGEFTEKDALNARILNEFIDAAPQFSGYLVRGIRVPEGTKFRKGDKLKSDGSITSWTTEESTARGFLGESGQAVILHVKASKGADISKPGYSPLYYLDNEVLQRRGYDGSLTISKVVSKSEYRNAFSVRKGKEKIIHVYLEE